LRPQSAKSKGRWLQKWVVQMILSLYKLLEPDDVRSTSMGASGEDVLLSPAARKLFPYSVECKNVEKLNHSSAWDQTVSNAGDYEPALFTKKNRREVLVTIRAEHFFKLLEKLYEKQMDTKN